MEHQSKLFEQLIKNVDTMTLDEFKAKKQEISDLAHDLFRSEITQAFQAGVESQLEDTAEEYFRQCYPMVNWP